jgi:hypothetical protein
MGTRTFRLSLGLLALLTLTGLASGAIAQDTGASRRAQEARRADLAQWREAWFYRQRAYPHRYIPAGAHLRALQQLDQHIAAEQAGPLAAPATPSWTLVGPQPIDTPYYAAAVSGRVSALAVVPGNPNVLYLGGAQGGVWKSVDGGANWVPLTDTQASTAIGSLAIDPANSNTIYVGTGEENFSGDSYYGSGILKSTDGGSTWTHTCGPFCGPVGSDSYGGGARIGGLAIQPGNSQVLLAAVAKLNNDGIYRSTDGGNTWSRVLAGNPGNAVMFDPTHGSVAYASLGSSAGGGTEGVFKSTDGGQSWNPDNGTGTSALPLTNAARIALALAPSSPATLYAGIADTGGNLLGLFKTADGGAHWARLASAPDYCDQQCWYDNVIAVQPTNANVVFAGGAYFTTLVRTLDGGTTWSTLQSAQSFAVVHPDVHALTFSGDGTTLYLGSDGGAYRATAVAATNPSFSGLNVTLALTQFYPGLSIHPTDAAIAVGGNQDNGTVLYSGGLTWNQVNCGDGSATAFDFRTPTTLYAACEWGGGLFKSTTGGSVGSWNNAANGIATSDRADFIPPLVMDPSNSTTLYFASFRVYRTTDGAASWTVISPDLTGGSSYDGVISAIAVAPADSNTVYVGTLDGRVQKTANAGSGTTATWTNVSAGLPLRAVTQVAVDPSIAKTAYATFSGFSGFGDSQGHVFRTTNGGAAWTDISGNLPNTPANALVIVPDVPSVLFVGTDVGVFYTSNGGANWTSLTSGLPRVAVLGLTLHNPSRTLRAATHGRSAWDLDISSLLPTVSLTSMSPASAVAGGAGFTLTLNGVEFDSSSVARWNATSLATTFVNTTQITALVPAKDIAAAGAVPITVFNASSNQTSNPKAFTVMRAATSTTLAPSVNPMLFGQAVTFMATVKPVSSGTPTGLVTFKDGATTLGTKTLGSGKAAFTTSALAAGVHSIAAVYGGDANFTGSTSGVLTETVKKASTSTSISSSLNPAKYGSAVTFTGTVKSSTTGVPTGAVTFKNGATTLGTKTLGGGKAAFTTSALAVGAHSVTAGYGGDANFTGSTSGVLTETVNKASTSTSVSSSLNPANHGSPVTFTATVKSSTTGVPTGAVTFKDGATTLGTKTLGGGKATFTTSTLAVGAHSITAVYGGDANFIASTSPALTQTVKP